MNWRKQKKLRNNRFKEKHGSIKTEQAIKCEHQYLASQGVDVSFLDNLQEYTCVQPSKIKPVQMYGLNDISLWDFDDWMAVKVCGILKAIRQYRHFTEEDLIFNIEVLDNQEKSIVLHNVKLDACLDWCINMLERYLVDSNDWRCRHAELLVEYAMTILGQILPCLVVDPPVFQTCLRNASQYLIHPLCTYRWRTMIESGIDLGGKHSSSQGIMSMCNDGIALDYLSRRQKKFVEWYGIHPDVLTNPAFYIAAKAVEGMHAEVLTDWIDWDFVYEDGSSIRSLCNTAEKNLLEYLRSGDAVAFAEGMRDFGKVFPGLWN